MKLMILGATLSAFAAVAPLSAQSRGNQGVPPGQMPPAGMCRVWFDGVAPGRQPRPTDCASARANVPRNARVIYGNNSNVYGNNNSRQDCTYSRSTNSVGDIIFGRSANNNTNCVDNTNSRVSGGWYQVGRDNNGGTIYERQTRDRNGNLVIQRARRNSNGSLSVISTRNAGNVNNGTYNNSTYNNGTYNNGTASPRPVRVNDRGYNNDQNYNNDDHGKGKKNKGDKDHGNGRGHDKD
jgi:hypothetical protein